MKSQLELLEYLKNKLADCEALRDKWHDMSLNDDRGFIREELSYYRGQINVIRILLTFLNDETTTPNN